MSKNVQNEIEGAAIDVLVGIVEEIKSKYHFSDTELISFLDKVGTSHLMNDTNLLFGLMHDDEDKAINIFTGRTKI